MKILPLEWQETSSRCGKILKAKTLKNPYVISLHKDLITEFRIIDDKISNIVTDPNYNYTLEELKQKCQEIHNETVKSYYDLILTFIEE